MTTSRSEMSLAEDARPQRRPSRRTLLTAGGVTAGAGALALAMPRQAPAEAATSYVVQGAQVVSVNDAAYGATGNGTTDDTAAIQAALNAAAALNPASGGVCLFPAPASSYLISATLVVPSGVSVIGPAVAPPGKPRSASTPTPPTITVATKTPTGDVVKLDAVISDSAFTSSGSAPPPSSAILIRGLVIDGGARNSPAPTGPGHGIALLASASAVVDCMVQNTVGDGILITDTSALPSTTAGTIVENVVRDCRVYQPGGIGIAIHAASTSGANTDGYCENNIVDCNAVNGFAGSASSPGIEVDNAAGWRIVGNHVYAILGDAYYITRADQTWVERNYADSFGYQSTSGKTYYGFYITVSDYGRTSVTHNHADSNEAAGGSGQGTFVYYYVTANASGATNEISFIDNSARQVTTTTAPGTSTAWSFAAGSGGALTVQGLTGLPSVTTGTPYNPSTEPQGLNPYPSVSGTVTFPGYTGPMTPYTPANPAAGPSNTDTVMAGLGSTITYTPAVTGKLVVTITGDARTTGTAVGLDIALRWGTGSAPPNGTTPAAGTAFGAGQFLGAPSTSVNAGWTLTGVITGATPGVPVWIDVAFSTTNGSDPAVLVNISATVQEVS
jgi:hypothetical protein